MAVVKPCRNILKFVKYLRYARLSDVKNPEWMIKTVKPKEVKMLSFLMQFPRPV